jgi:cation transport regulator ChaB
MPYGSKDIPSGTEKVPAHGQAIYRAAFNAAYKKYGEAKAHAIAWAAVKTKFKKKGDKWGTKDGDLLGHPFRGNQYTSGQGGGEESGAEARGAASENWQHGNNHNHPGEGYSAEAKVDEHGVIHTTNVDDAALALSENRKVELNQPNEVSTLLDRLGDISKDMIAKGEKAPDFNLCNVSVHGTNLFCSENLNIERDFMPQLAPDGQPGDAEHFVQWMKDRGYSVSNDTEYAAHLRATQNQLNGGKVAGVAKYMETEKGRSLQDRPIVVSRDNYILDGHHSWAAKIGLDARDNILADDKKMSVRRVDTNIVNLLYAAEDFTGGKGHKSAKDRKWWDIWSEEAREASAEARRRNKKEKEKEKRGKASEWVGGYRVKTKGWGSAHTHAYGHTSQWGSHGDEAMIDKEFSGERRKELAKKGEAMPGGGGYPIENKGDLKNAIQAFGRAKNKGATKAWIKKRAKALGAEEMLPENWDALPSMLEAIKEAWDAVGDRDCPDCGGTGKDDDGDTCPTCGGDGYIEDADPDDDDDDEDEDDCLKCGDRRNFNDGVLILDGKPRKTKDGYLVATARIARTGIQLYHGEEVGRPDLPVVRVYRPPEEVFSRRAMQSLAHRPITLEHPPEMVDAKNWKTYAIGHIGEDVTRDGDCIRVPMVMMDSRAIDAFDAGVKELSVGYSTDIKWEDGVTPAGEKYDAIQTRIRGNHLAVVPAARGGSLLTIGDDKNGGLNMSTRIVIDGQPIEFASELAAKHVQDAIALLSKQLADAKKKAGEEAEEEQEEEKKTRGEMDALKGEIVVLKKQLEDAKKELSGPAMDARVKERTEVRMKADALMQGKVNFDGKEPAEIKRAVATAQLGDVSAMSDGEVAGAFLALTRDVKIGGMSGHGVSRMADALSGLNFGGGSLVDAKALRDAAWLERQKAQQNAWKGPQHTLAKQ